MQSVKKNLQACSTPAACEALGLAYNLGYHRPDPAAATLDDGRVFVPFLGEPWFSGRVSVNTQGKAGCASMRFANEGTPDLNYEVASSHCGSSAPYVCAFTCGESECDIKGCAFLI